MTPTAIVARDAQGQQRWQYGFPGQRIEPPQERQRHPVEWVGGTTPSFIGATGLHVAIANEVVTSGRLMSLTPRGDLARAFSFDDRLTFGAGTIGR